MTPQLSNRLSVLRRCLAAALLPLLALTAGCEHDSHDDRDSSGNNASSGSSQAAAENSALVGSWRLVPESGDAWFVHFASDGTWKITDDAAGTAHRVHGTYTVTGNRYSGPMVNPNVGEGRIEGSFDNDALTMDFIEYWHSPAKHVPYTGTKL